MADDKNTQGDITITPTGSDIGSSQSGTSDQKGGAQTAVKSAQPAKPAHIQLPGDMSDDPDAEVAAKSKNPSSQAFSLEEDALAAEQAMAPPEKYSVPKLVQEKFPDLIDLIKNTESMDDDERDYWMQILPIMTEEQIMKFREILVTEKQQLERLDKEYEQELSKLNEKHMIEWKEFETKEQKAELEKKEKKAEKEEKESEEELLKRLQEI